MVNFGGFLKFEAMGQTVLPYMSILMVVQKLIKMPKVVNFGDILKTWSFGSNSVTRQVNFEWAKVNKKCQKWSILASFWKPEALGQTVLPDRSSLIEQKLVEKAKIEKFKWDILGDFLTMWNVVIKSGLSLMTDLVGMCRDPSSLIDKVNPKYLP